jgi:Zn-finger nucleic acid-binding protein
MRPRAPRKLECPVCIGAALDAFRPSDKSPLTLDYCKRCGGIWFDAGEVPALRTVQPEALQGRVTLSPEAFRMKCHECHASFDRNLPKCTACGWENRLSCPACRTTLQTVEHDKLRIDACPKCRGVWFDNVELAAIWNGQVEALAKKTGRSAAVAGGERDHFLLHSLLWVDPFSVGYIAASGVEAVAHGAGALAPMAGAALEGGAEVAGGVFEAIASVIASIFEGLGDL